MEKERNNSPTLPNEVAKGQTATNVDTAQIADTAAQKKECSQYELDLERALSLYHALKGVHDRDNGCGTFENCHRPISKACSQRPGFFRNVRQRLQNGRIWNPCLDTLAHVSEVLDVTLPCLASTYQEDYKYFVFHMRLRYTDDIPITRRDIEEFIKEYLRYRRVMPDSPFWNNPILAIRTFMSNHKSTDVYITSLMDVAHDLLMDLIELILRVQLYVKYGRVDYSDDVIEDLRSGKLEISNVPEGAI